MFLLYLYIASAIVGYVEVADFLVSFYLRTKKEGYKIADKDKYGRKVKKIDFFKENQDYVFGPIIPGFNLFFVFFLFKKKEENLHKLKHRYIKREKIYIPNKEDNNKKEEQVVSKKKELPVVQPTVVKNKVLKKSLKKTYNREQ